MERTRDLRLEPGQPLNISVINEGGRTVSARITSRHGCRIVLSAEEPVACHSPLRIDLSDSLILAQVSDCIFGDAAYLLTVDVMHAIPSLNDLAKLVAVVMSEGRAPSPLVSQQVHAYAEVGRVAR